MARRVDALAHRVQSDRYFLASALADYAASEGFDEEDIAGFLNCSLDTLSLVALCRRPRPDVVLFQSDVNRIASRFSLDAQALAEVVRRSDALSTLKQAPADTGLLLAARDRELKASRGNKNRRLE